MEEEQLIFINKVYEDLIKKSNCNNNILVSIKLINRLIKNDYIKDSYVLIRSIFEELMAELAIISNPQFKIDVKTKPGDIRCEVINHIDLLFKNETIDDIFLKDIYDYLSNISHESTTRRLLKDLVNNKKSKYAIKCNTYYVLCIVSYIYLNYLYKGKKESDFIDKLFVIGIGSLFTSFYSFVTNLTEEERKRYNSYFITERDINFINKKNNEIMDISNNIKEDPIDLDEINSYFEDIDELINRFNYRKLYNNIFKFEENN